MLTFGIIIFGIATLGFIGYHLTKCYNLYLDYKINSSILMLTISDKKQYFFLEYLIQKAYKERTLNLEPNPFKVGIEEIGYLNFSALNIPTQPVINIQFNDPITQPGYLLEYPKTEKERNEYNKNKELLSKFNNTTLFESRYEMEDGKLVDNFEKWKTAFEIKGDDKNVN